MEKTQVCKMLSAPMIFWPYISVGKWNLLSDKEQDILVEAAKIVLNINPEFQSPKAE